MGGSPTLEECFRTLEELRNIRDMSSLYQFERRLFSRPCDTRAHKISSLCLRPESVQIPNAPLRSLYNTKVFTRVVRVKVQGVNMHQYLDWLLKKQLRALIDRQRNLTLFWVNKLGFLMNKGKSQLVPTHHPAFLGSTLDLLRMVVLIFEHWPTPHVDLFAFEQNQVSFSAGPSPLSSGSNALIQNWEHLYGYSFPPLSLIPRILRKQVAAVSPYPIDGAVLAQSTVVTSADDHAGGPPMGDLVPGPPPEELGHGNVHVDLFAFEQNQVFFSAGQPPEELGHRNVLPFAGYLYGLPPRILC